ncbi:MAG: PLP-dependent aminotransferase family protein [Eubacterium sp.]|nr:PLP-dependent aminotransferase family protein [Eubacterium sp.]
MRYTIDRSAKQPAYLQLYLQMREDIVTGAYPYGARLPSKRLVTSELGISVITVEHTYAILCDEGYAESRERSGYYVCYREPDVVPVAGTVSSATASRNLSGNDALPGASGNKLDAYSEKRLRHQERDVMDETSRSGASDGSDGIPYGILARTMRRVLTAQGEKVLVKSPGSGIPELRIAIASYLARSRGIRIEPSQVIIGSGAEYLYSLIVQLLGHDRIYALEDPSYEKIRRMYEANGVVCDMLKMGPEGIRSDALAHTKATVLHVTPFNSYPSGITASASKRREYIRWATERNGTIIEDDFDSEFTFSSKAEDTLFSLEPKKTVIYLNTFSKTVSPSIRIGYMILPEELTGQFQAKVGFYSSTVPTFEQYVLTDLINRGDFERHINSVRRRRRKEMKQTV